MRRVLPIEGGHAVRVVLADDQALVRAGFRVLLETEDGFEVCGEAADGAEAVAPPARHRPDVVVMDIRMPGMDGLAATKLITADPGLAEVKVLVLTTFDLDEYVFEALRAGRAGFLLKDTEPVELLRALRVVAAGDALLAPTVTRKADQRVPVPARAAQARRQRAARADRPGTRGAGARRGRHVQRRDRHAPGDQPGDVTHARQPHPHQARARDRSQLVVLAYESGLVTPNRR